jgi:hypothetical protein
MKPRIAFLLLTAALMAPLSAHALFIQFCVPNCATDTVKQTFTSQPGQTVTDPVTGVVTTTVPLAAFVYQQFTITATVTAQQSGTLQKITFNPTTITANTGSGCSTTAPCQLEVTATSDAIDFPMQKPVGGYPAGVFMMGSFAGIQPVNNGDTIAMTGSASGLVTGDTGTVVIGTDIINNTPGTGPANAPVSLPSSCSGIATCNFMATNLKRAFSTQITETIQQDCGGLEACPTQLATRLNVQIKTPGNRVSLPLDYITTNVDPSRPDINPTELLTVKLAPQFGSMDVNLLAVFANDFAVTATVKLGNGNTIDPSTEEVFLRIGDFSMTILPGKFKKLLQGKLYTFIGKIDNRDVVASFARDPRDPNVWTFLGGVHGVQLTGLPHAPLQTPVQIGVGSDVGSDLVIARFF